VWTTLQCTLSWNSIEFKFNSTSATEFNSTMRLRFNWNEFNSNSIQKNGLQIDAEGIQSFIVYMVLGKKNFKRTQIQKDAFPWLFTCE
jgi:hypothetical protein